MARIEIIAAPFHSGAFGERVGAGPLRLLDDGLETALRGDAHEVECRTIAPVDDFEGEIGRAFEVKRRIAAAVAEAAREEAFPIVLAGNCNVEVGVVAGLGEREAGLFWFDAHPDFDTPDEHRSGYLDGMGVATLAGQCWRALAATIPGFDPFDLSRFVYCGIRDFDPGQREKVRAAGIRAAVGSKEQPVDYPATFRQAIEAVRFDRAMFHLDVDCLDPSVGIANEYAAPGGLSAEQLRECVGLACTAARPVSLTIASFNPAFEGADRISAAAIASALQVAAAA